MHMCGVPAGTEHVERGWAAHAGADAPLAHPKFVTSARHTRKRKGTISETSVGSHSGQLFSYHGNSPVGNCFNFREIATNNNKHNEKWYTATSQSYLLLDFSGL